MRRTLEHLALGKGIDFARTPTLAEMIAGYPSPSACPCCSSVLHKLGEDVTETLEFPRQADAAF